MSLLVESIRVENGELMNIGFHNIRMNRSLSDLFGVGLNKKLENEIIIPDYAMSGVYKCRVVYENIIRQIEFIPYKMRIINSLKLVEDNAIEYSHKYVNREWIEKLASERGGCDEILIVKNGMITDSSYSNVIFRTHEGKWKTPSTYLLAGTRRAALLQSGLISETSISYKDIGNYTEIKLINAMIGIEDTQGIPVSSIS